MRHTRLVRSPIRDPPERWLIYQPCVLWVIRGVDGVVIIDNRNKLVVDARDEVHERWSESGSNASSPHPQPQLNVFYYLTELPTLTLEMKMFIPQILLDCAPTPDWILVTARFSI